MEGIWSSLTKYHGLDWVGIIFSMLSTYYLTRKRKRGFILGMVGNIAFVGFGIFAQSAANVLANGTYFVLNARGWLKWKDDPPKPEKKAEEPADLQEPVSSHPN